MAHHHHTTTVDALRGELQSELVAPPWEGLAPQALLDALVQHLRVTLGEAPRRGGGPFRPWLRVGPTERRLLRHALHALTHARGRVTTQELRSLFAAILPPGPAPCGRGAVRWRLPCLGGEGNDRVTWFRWVPAEGRWAGAAPGGPYGLTVAPYRSPRSRWRRVLRTQMALARHRGLHGGIRSALLEEQLRTLARQIYRHACERLRSRSTGADPEDGARRDPAWVVYTTVAEDDEDSLLL